MKNIIYYIYNPINKRKMEIEKKKTGNRIVDPFIFLKGNFCSFVTYLIKIEHKQMCRRGLI